jgi:hypothetical protein
LTEHLGGFTGKERWKVIDTDHTQRRALCSRWKGNRYCRFVESSGDVVYGNRVIRVSAASSEKGLENFAMIGSIATRETYVSALTSQMTDKRRLGVERDSTLTKWGIFEER